MRKTTRRVAGIGATLLAAASMSLATTSPASAEEYHPGSWVGTGTNWAPGEDTYSMTTHLVMQDDGNFVLYCRNGTGQDALAIWNSGTWGNPGAHATFQADGNLVVYSSQGTPLWYSGTYGSGGNQLAVQDDNNLVIYRDDDTPVWQSNTYHACPAYTRLD
ncbi:hypothetical protein ACIRSU_11685 [Streptomyces sp. NPDC101160]|uniref:hypothetical protein n=1 Tax=Streptomyces sp. NPDC101160 TaxID=3366118 RepID=UPI00382F3C91